MKSQKHKCQLRGCKRPAVIEMSGWALKSAGWWKMCLEHSRGVFAAQRPLK